jgi:hypothetical protein
LTPLSGFRLIALMDGVVTAESPNQGATALDGLIIFAGAECTLGVTLQLYSCE